MQTGKIEANLLRLNEEFKLPLLPDLIQLKLSGSEKGILEDVNLEFHQQEYKRLFNELKQASLSSFLPENPNCQTELNELLVRARLAYNK